MQTRKHLCKQNISVDQNGEKRTNINWKAFKVRKEELNKARVLIIMSNLFHSYEMSHIISAIRYESYNESFNMSHTINYTFEPMIETYARSKPSEAVGITKSSV